MQPDHTRVRRGPWHGEEVTGGGGVGRARFRGRLLIVAMPETPHLATISELVGLIPEHRPDRIIVFCPHPGRHPNRPSVGSRPCATRAAITVLRRAHPGPVYLQLALATLPADSSALVASRPTSGGQLAPADPNLRWLPPVAHIASGWVSVNTATPAAGAYPGSQAIQLARTAEKSIVLKGESLGLIGETAAVPDGTSRTLWGLELAAVHARAGQPGGLARPGVAVIEAGDPDAAAYIVPFPTRRPRSCTATPVAGPLDQPLTSSDRPTHRR